MSLLQEALDVWDDRDLFQRQAAADMTEWDLAEPTVRFRLAQLVHSWVHGERISKLVLEKRMRNAFIKNTPTEGPNQPVTTVKPTTGYGRNSYKAVLCGTQQVDPTLLDGAVTVELKHLTTLCLQECETGETTRAPTSDEIKAIDLVLQQRIELPHPPLFIRQIMDIEEQAHFAHIFQTMEYPLYAHLDPGQFLQSEISPKVLFALIQVDDAASKEQQLQVASFKDSTSRVTLDSETRILTFWFGSKTRARSWAGWRVPVATRTLLLHDYRALEDVPEEKRPVTRFTSFRFQVECKSGEMSPLSMQHLLCNELQLPVVQLSHPQLALRCEDNGVWDAVTLGPRCPPILRQTTVIKYGKVRLTILLPDIFACRPCGLCKDHAHPSQRCTRTQAEASAYAKTRTRKVSTADDPARPPRMQRIAGIASYQRFVDYIATIRGTIQIPTARSALERVQIPVKDSSDNPNDAKRKPGGPKTETAAPHEAAQFVAPDEIEDILMTNGAEDIPSRPLVTEQPSGKNGRNSPKRTHSVLEGREEREHMAAWRINRAIWRVSNKRLRKCENGTDTVEVEDNQVHSKQQTIEEEQPYSSAAENEPHVSPKRKHSAMTARKHMAAWRISRAIRKASTKRQRYRTQAMVGPAAGNVEHSAGQCDEGHESPTQKLFGHNGDGNADTTANSTTEDHGQAQARSKRKLNTSYMHDYFTNAPKESHTDGRVAIPTILHDEGSDQHSGERTNDDGDELSTMADGASDEYPGTPPTMMEIISVHPTSLVTGLGSDNSYHNEADRIDPVLPDAAQTVDASNVVMEATSPKDSELEVNGPQPTTLNSRDAGQPLEIWLDLLDGKITDVDGNGQCGWLAFYAALNNIKASKLRLNAESVNDATILKAKVLRLMISRANDARDSGRFDYSWVAGLVDDISTADTPEPDKWLLWVDAMLDQCATTVDCQVPIRQWVSSAHIEAMAMLIREPILVIDMILPSTAYVQVYAYRVMPNQRNELMEEGCCFPMTSPQAARLIHSFRRARLFPLVLLLHRTDTGNHFQAVTYKPALYDDDAPDNPIDLRNQIMEANGLPALNDEQDDFDKLLGDVRRIRAKAMCRTKQGEVSHDSEADSSDDFEETTWQPSRPGRRAPEYTEEEYIALIGSGTSCKKGKHENTLLLKLRQANQRAYDCWHKSDRPEAVSFRHMHPGQKLFDLISEVGDHPLAARGMIATAPYPELLLRAISVKAIHKWGQWEARELQIAQLKKATRQPRIRQETRLWIEAWLTACEMADGPASMALAGSPDKWRELQRRSPGTVYRARPPHITQNEWYVLHVLPFVYTKWHTSLIAQMPTTSRAEWYDTDSAVQIICAGASTGDWTALFQLRSGITVITPKEIREISFASTRQTQVGVAELEHRL
jgi:hypothetical protein